MKRKEFILTATAAAVAVVFMPLLFGSCSDKKKYDPLIMPEMLGRFSDEETIREIGKRYRKQLAEENEKQKLTDLLLTDNSGKKIQGSDKAAITQLLEKKIKEEFSQSQIFILQGWVISRTEARQCALFSLS